MKDIQGVLAHRIACCVAAHAFDVEWCPLHTQSKQMQAALQVHLAHADLSWAKMRLRAGKQLLLQRSMDFILAYATR